MKEHVLKITQKLFKEIEEGRAFDIKKANHIKIGDVIYYEEIKDDGNSTGNGIVKQVTFKSDFMQRVEYFVLGIVDIDIKVLTQKYGFFKATLLLDGYPLSKIRIMSDKESVEIYSKRVQ